MELEKFTELLRKDFENELGWGDPAINSQGEFDIDYVAFLELRLFEAQKKIQELSKNV